MVVFSRRQSWIKYTECISGSRKFYPSGGKREESDIISGWCNSLHESVDSASQPPGRMPAGSGSLNSLQWSPYLFPAGEPLFQIGVFHCQGFFFSVKHITSPILIIFPFLPALYYSPDNVFLMFDLVGLIDFCKYMLMTATTISWNKLRQQQQKNKQKKKTQRKLWHLLGIFPR